MTKTPVTPEHTLTVIKGFENDIQILQSYTSRCKNWRARAAAMNLIKSWKEELEN